MRESGRESGVQREKFSTVSTIKLRRSERGLVGWREAVSRQRSGCAGRGVGVVQNA